MLELGNLCHPNALLGPGFQGQTFLVACDVFGEEPVKRIMNDQIQKTIA